MVVQETLSLAAVSQKMPNTSVVTVSETDNET